MEGLDESYEHRKVKELIGCLLTFSLKAPFIPKHQVLKLRLALGLKLHPLYIAVLTGGNEGLSRVCMDNLECVLEAVSKLVPYLKSLGKKNIIVTSDHGELLGKGGLYDH